MAAYNSGVDIPLKAAVDLDAWQYKFVKAGSVVGEVTGAATLGGSVLGVLQNDPRAGEEATVRVSGGTRVLGDGASAITHGGYVKTGSDGAALGAATPTAGSAIYISGIALDTLASGCAYVDILLIPSMRWE